MKKIISLLLAVVLCLCACGNGGGETPENQTQPPETEANTLNLVQEWRTISDGETVSFDADGYFHINGRSYAYEYDEEASMVIVDVGVPYNCPVTLVDGVYRIEVDGMEIVPASEYERLHAEYAETMMVIPGFDGTPALNASLVREHIERVELTVDNWSEYVREYSYDVKLIEKDAFGEIISEETVTAYRLGYGTDRYYCLNATIELKHKQTGEIVLLGGMLPVNVAEDINAVYSEPFGLENYECTRIKGYIYFVNYPAEIIAEVLDPYDRNRIDYYNASIAVTSDYFEGGWSVDCEAMVIESNSDNWSEYFE